MNLYYINKNAQANRDHEVHKSACSYLPEPQHQLYLGYFRNCQDDKPNDKKLGKFDDLFNKDQAGKDLLLELDKVVMHDAVLNVALVWKEIWLKIN